MNSATHLDDFHALPIEAVRERWASDGFEWFGTPERVAIAVRRTRNSVGITCAGQPYIQPEIGMAVTFDRIARGTISRVGKPMGSDPDGDPEVLIEKADGGFRYAFQTALNGYAVVHPAALIGPFIPPLYLEYERYDRVGNIRLKNSVLVTGVSAGDRVAESPGNGFLPVRNFGVAQRVEPFGDSLAVEVEWESGFTTSVSAQFLQRVRYGIAVGVGTCPSEASAGVPLPVNSLTTRFTEN